MRCAECECMNIVSIEDGCGAAAKCSKTPRGKTITWAMTGITPKDGHWKREEGKDRVLSFLAAKKAAPSWCPKKKGQ